MEEKPFIWTDQLTKRLCQMKFDHDWLFKKRKQPWAEFYKILLENGFPEEMTIDHVRKKWSYTWDTYKLAKKNRKKHWKYYKLFEKHYGKQVVLDKFESWTDEWRIKLINCMSGERELSNVESETMWRNVEKKLRTQELPIDCCIQDIKGLWHHLNTTFQRKHRYRLKKSTENTEWTLYDTMLDYYKRFCNDELVALESEWRQYPVVYHPKISDVKIVSLEREEHVNDEENEFNWTKNTTESFIQLRLQNDPMFKERPQAWKEFGLLLHKEYGFPNTLSSREACRKWATIISEYQKAKATNNTSWLYYHLFELYLGEGKLSLNPLVDWQEEWVFQLITAKTALEDSFEYSKKNRNEGWRDVEKRLRLNGIPLDHSLLELPDIWEHLRRTFRWKKKFKTKGILSEKWPYYEAMEKYTEKPKLKIVLKKRSKADCGMENDCIDNDNDDYEDDMKLFDLKQKLDLRPKDEFSSDLCRACADAQASVNIFEQKDADGTSLATKLNALAGVEMDQSDNLPAQICYDCLQELENAYTFRLKCLKADQHFRGSKIKIEFQIPIKNDDIPFTDQDDDMDRTDFEDNENINANKTVTNKIKIKTVVKKEKIRRKRRVRQSRYDYWKICEICGKNTKNLVSHLDTHNTDKKYSCDVCDKKFKFKSGLIIHKAVHNPTPRKTCEVCGKTFHILAQYRKHYVYHANERRFECETCGKRFNTLDILRVHNMTHTDERPFACSECGKTFRTAGCVSRHKRIVHRSIKKT